MTKVRREQFYLFYEQIALLLTKDERIARKTDERILFNPALDQHRTSDQSNSENGRIGFFFLRIHTVTERAEKPITDGFRDTVRSLISDRPKFLGKGLYNVHT